MASTTGGRLDCAEIVIQTMSTNEPKVILPCTGDRVFGMAQDNEMVFSAPWQYADEIVAGLEGTHKGGDRYPITVAMRSTVRTSSPSEAAYTAAASPAGPAPTTTRSCTSAGLISASRPAQ